MWTSETVGSGFGSLFPCFLMDPRVEISAGEGIPEGASSFTAQSASTVIPVLSVAG